MKKDLAEYFEKHSKEVSQPADFNTVDLPFVRQGIHWYEVRYAYHDGQGARPALGDYGPRREAKKRVEAWSAADAVVQVAIYVDSLYASSRCKILEVSPVTK